VTSPTIQRYALSAHLSDLENRRNNMVQRYELELFHQKGGSVNPCDDGGYIEYEDYAKLEAELQKYKDQFPDYVECANCGSVTHVEGVE
jgi:hypothetical protein